MELYQLDLFETAEEECKHKEEELFYSSANDSGVSAFNEDIWIPNMYF